MILLLVSRGVATDMQVARHSIVGYEDRTLPQYHPRRPSRHLLRQKNLRQIRQLRPAMEPFCKGFLRRPRHQQFPRQTQNRRRPLAHCPRVNNGKEVYKRVVGEN